MRRRSLRRVRGLFAPQLIGLAGEGHELVIQGDHLRGGRRPLAHGHVPDGRQAADVLP